MFLFFKLSLKRLNLSVFSSHKITLEIFLLIIFIGTMIFLKYYKKRAKKDEAKLEEKNLAE